MSFSITCPKYRVVFTIKNLYLKNYIYLISITGRFGGCGSLSVLCNIYTGWRVGGMEGWRVGGVGWVEGWRDGGVEGWRGGGMESVGRVEDHETRH